MGINRSWNTTLSFRRFRLKTHELSKVYWTQQMSADSLLNQLKGKNPKDISSQIIDCSFDSKMYSQEVQDTISWIPKYMERNRLHLLAIYTAFLETYLKEITFYHCASLGYIANANEKKDPLKLNTVGTAITAPIIKSSTVPEMIKYAGEYYGVDFGINATAWVKIYKVRCAAVHNGGIATPGFLKAINGHPLSLNPKTYENIGLTWDELRTFMRYADEISATIDYKVSNYNIKLIEIEEVLRELKSKKTLPAKSKLWEHLSNEYSFIGVKRENKVQLVKKFY